MTSTAVANNATGLTEAKKKSIQIKLFFRVWWLMFCTSYTKQQGTSTVWQLEPFLADIYGKDTDEYYDALQRHQNFFNTTPMFASFIYAIVISMEYERKAALDAGKDFDDASIEAIKVALMGPIAGIGDSIQLSCLRVIAPRVLPSASPSRVPGSAPSSLLLSITSPIRSSTGSAVAWA